MFTWLRRIFIHFLINFAALYAAAKFVEGITITAAGDDIWRALALASIVFGVVNVLLRPLLAFFSLPFIVLTLGLFMFVLNGLMLYLTAWLVADYHIENFTAAVWGALLVTVIHWCSTWLVSETLKNEGRG